MHIEVRSLRQYVSVAVAFIFPLIVPFPDIELPPAVCLIADDAPVCLCDKNISLQKNSSRIPTEKTPETGGKMKNFFRRCPLTEKYLSNNQDKKQPKIIPPHINFSNIF